MDDLSSIGHLETARPVPALRASAPAAPPLPASLTPASKPSSYAEGLLQEVNAYRRSRRLVPLEPSPALEQIAQQHSDAMAAQRRLTHQGFDRRFRAAAAEGFRLCGENVANGYPNHERVLDAWRQSAGHDRNLNHPEFTRVGVAVSQSDPRAAAEAKSAAPGPWVTFFACR